MKILLLLDDDEHIHNIFSMILPNTEMDSIFVRR